MTATKLPFQQATITGDRVHILWLLSGARYDLKERVALYERRGLDPAHLHEQLTEVENLIETLKYEEASK